MTRAAIVIVPPAAPRDLAAIAQALGQSVAVVVRRVTAAAPVYDPVLFMNDHDDVSTRLRTVIRLAGQAGLALRVFELDDAEPLSPQAEISAEILENILSAADGDRDTR